MSRKTYRVETMWSDKWHTVYESTLSGCHGYLDAVKNGWSPRSAYRLFRSDGKVVRELEAEPEATVGMIAGFPTAEQHDHAAQRATERAAEIRKREARRGTR